MDVSRNTGMNPANLMVLSEQSHWPQGRPLAAHCTQAVTRFPDLFDPLELEEILVTSARSLLRGKLLDGTKMKGRLRIFAFAKKRSEGAMISALAPQPSYLIFF